MVFKSYHPHIHKEYREHHVFNSNAKAVYQRTLTELLTELQLGSNDLLENYDIDISFEQLLGACRFDVLYINIHSSMSFWYFTFTGKKCRNRENKIWFSKLILRAGCYLFILLLFFLPGIYGVYMFRYVQSQGSWSAPLLNWGFWLAPPQKEGDWSVPTLTTLTDSSDWPLTCKTHCVRSQPPAPAFML